MKFYTLSRLTYLIRARHHGGHGIHSPFLYHLITAVIEDKQIYPEYKILKDLHSKALHQFRHSFGMPSVKINSQFLLSDSDLRKLYKKLELPRHLSELIFRLIREFKPSGVINYGPALGINLAAMALACYPKQVYVITNNPLYELFTDDLLKDSSISNICFIPENSESSIQSEFILINYTDNPEKSRTIIQNCLNRHGDNDLIILRGIHHSAEMEILWNDMVAHKSIRVSLDLFNIGITLFRKESQKENFIYRV
jgi:hypothetical protein